MAKAPPLDLGFLSTDVRKQYDISQEILDQATKLRELLPHASRETSSHIEEVIRNLVGSAENLSVNASTTSSNTAATIISTIPKSS